MGGGEIGVSLLLEGLGLGPGLLASDVVEISVVTGRRRYTLSNGVRLVSGGVHRLNQRRGPPIVFILNCNKKPKT